MTPAGFEMNGYDWSSINARGQSGRQWSGILWSIR